MGNGNGGLNAFELLDGLKNVGFRQDQAEFMAKVLVRTDSENTATKQDLELAKLELKEAIKALDVKIETVRSELKKDIKGIEKDIEALRGGLKKDMVIASGSIIFIILTGLATLAKLGLLTPMAPTP